MNGMTSRLHRRLRPDALRPRPAQEPRRRRSALVREAAGQGADYVQTPEMTALVERNRASPVREDRPGGARSDARRACARSPRETGVIVHVGSLAVRAGDKVANRAFLIDPAARSSPPTTRSTCSTWICRTARAGANPRTYTGGDRAVAGRDAVGPSRPDDLLRRALPGALPRARRGRRLFLSAPACFTRQTGEAHWHVLQRARADRDRLLHDLGRAGRQARGRPRDLRPFAHRRSLGPRARRGRDRARA